MRLLRQKGWLLLFVLVWLPLHACVRAAQTLSQSQWQELTKDKVFDYREAHEFIVPPADNTSGIFQKMFGMLFELLSSPAGNLLLWIIIISAVLFVVYKLFVGNSSFLFSKGKKIMEEAAVTQDDEDIAATDWDVLLQHAINNNDLRMAVRYSYMRLLQLLQQQELIQYRPDKTNYHYYTELGESTYRRPFRQLSRQYEYVWYGHFALPPETYGAYMSLFNNLKKQLGS